MKKSPIRQGKESDLLAIQKLLSTYFLDMEELKPEDFWVYEIEEKIIGCAALVELEPESEVQKDQKGNQKFAEIHSIAVHPNFRGKKIGTELIKYLLGNNNLRSENLEPEKLEPKKIGKGFTPAVYVRTSCPDFFQKLKFKPIADSEKFLLWEDCKTCEHFETCTQHAMKYEYEVEKPEKPEYKERSNNIEAIEK